MTRRRPRPKLNGCPFCGGYITKMMERPYCAHCGKYLDESTKVPFSPERDVLRYGTKAKPQGIDSEDDIDV